MGKNTHKDTIKFLKERLQGLDTWGKDLTWANSHNKDYKMRMSVQHQDCERGWVSIELPVETEMIIHSASMISKRINRLKDAIDVINFEISHEQEGDFCEYVAKGRRQNGY